MKLKRAILGFVCLITVLSFGLMGCGNNNSLGNKEKGDRIDINFLCNVNQTSEKAWNDLITAYNDGVGYEEDNVYVTKKIGNGSPSSNYFTQSSNYAPNVIAVNDSQNNGLQSLMIQYENKRAPDGYFLNLTEYAKADEDFQSNDIAKQTMDWGRMTYNKDADKGVGKPKHIIGADQNLMAVPYGVSPQVNWYNERLFKEQGINIISVPEENLTKYNTDNQASIKPHGYAEYKDAPFSGAVKSKTLAKDDVYKVFNNCIGMNWEEMRYLLKYFSKSWNTSSTSDYGFVSEYWFNFGWSIGGDVMGYNGTDYDFILTDKNPNYIVTLDNTIINGVTYKAGEIVRYEDRVQGIDNAATKPSGIHAIASQYDATKEYIALNINKNTTIDTVNGTEYKGYEVANPDTGSSVNWFNTAQTAMVRGDIGGIGERLNQKDAADFNLCPNETYREYEGGSTYQKNGQTGFNNEYLKVIGETYEGEVYTGDLKIINGTPVVGNTTTASISEYLVIPSASDSEKYKAAWDFISWVATEGQKYIAYTNTLAPVSQEILFSDSYAYNEDLSKGKNFHAVAMMANNTSRGDWGYFESGTWVTNWANDFNGFVRKGTMTLDAFEKKNSASAKNSLNGMKCIIQGIR